MDRPKVIVLNGASIDGKLAVSPEILLLYGDKRWQALGGESAFDIFEWLKSENNISATLEGSGSFIREGDVPEPLTAYKGDPKSLYQDFLPEQALHRQGHKGWFTVVDGRGRIRWMHKDEYPDEAWQGWHLLVMVCQSTPSDYLAYLQRDKVPYLVAGDTKVDLNQALNKMKEKLGVTSLLSTAGGKLNGALLRQGLVDEINIEFLPAVIGGFTTPSLFSSPDLKPDEVPINLELISAQIQPNGRIWLRYNVVKETR
jgi:riboflavin biosynthesis pyrimidine reductase